MLASYMYAVLIYCRFLFAAASGWETEQVEQAVLAIAKILMDGAKVGAKRGCS